MNSYFQVIWFVTNLQGKSPGEYQRLVKIGEFLLGALNLHPLSEEIPDNVQHIYCHQNSRQLIKKKAFLTKNRTETEKTTKNLRKKIKNPNFFSKKVKPPISNRILAVSLSANFKGIGKQKRRFGEKWKAKNNLHQE